MYIKRAMAICLLALVPALAMSLPITSMPTDSSSADPDFLRHNVFHDTTLAGGQGGNVLAWFDLDTSMSSTWDPVTGALSLHVNIFADPAQNTLLGTGHATSANLFGAGFGDFDDISLGMITWAFDPGAAAALFTAGLPMEFIDHSYHPDTAGNLANTYVGNTVTLWGSDGVHDGNGFFNGSSLGVDMVFTVPEPAILLLMAMGLLGIGATVRRR